MDVLDRIPAWSTTGIGSLPFDIPAAASEHACSSYDVPFCPQLPGLEGDMVAEWLGPDPQLSDWPPASGRVSPLAWDSFLEQVSRRAPEHRVVKLQVTGPLTLAYALGRDSAQGSIKAADAGLVREISSWLAKNVDHQARALRSKGLDVLLVVDEPVLANSGTLGAERAWEALRMLTPAWGLHLCCAVPWDLVERADPDLLSFDLVEEKIDDRATDALRRLSGRGGKIAWGAIACHRPEFSADAVARLRTVASRIPDIAENSLLSPSCGTGRMPPRREREIAASLREAKRSMLRQTSAESGRAAPEK